MLVCKHRSLCARPITPSKDFLHLTHEVRVISKVIGKFFIILIRPDEVLVATVFIETVHWIMRGRVLDFAAVIGIELVFQ